MKNLFLPYRTQLDNQLNPLGSCQVTSLAMCLTYWGIAGYALMPQLEDELTKLAAANGLDPKEPAGLQALAREYDRVDDDLTYSGSVADIRRAIDAGYPCIVHGYFTRSGHVIVIRGYDDTGFYVNDPYGEAFWEGGKSFCVYDTNRTGENLHYSYNMITAICSPESNPAQDIWLHRISRRGLTIH